MAKHREYFERMLKEHKRLMDEFSHIHHQYMMDRNKWQGLFNRQGRKVLEVVAEYENRLCLHSEKGQYGKFSAQLGEKFRAEVKKMFPLIDFVGVTIASVKDDKQKDPIDSLKRIRF